MTTHREGIFVEGLWVEKEPLKNEPFVPEVGLSSAPLESMSFFFNSACSKYSDDYVLCKTENTDPKKCLLEGRKVTRCALDLISKLKSQCQDSWQAHWECLDMNNHTFYKCRSQETEFNDCVFSKLVNFLFEMIEIDIFVNLGIDKSDSRHTKRTRSRSY